MASNITIVDLIKQPEIRESVYEHYTRCADIYQDENKHVYDALWDRLDDTRCFMWFMIIMNFWV